MTPRIIEIQSGVWEIIDEHGVSVFSTHCVDCGSQFFFSNIHLLEYRVVCQDCKEVRNVPEVEERAEILQPTANKTSVQVSCKNFSQCNQLMNRTRKYARNPTCYPCRREEVRLNDQRRRHAKV